MRGASRILTTAFPTAPTCLSLVGMDETDVAQLRRRLEIIRRTSESLTADLRLVSSDDGASALWFMQKGSLETNAGGLDIQQRDGSMHVHFPTQDGVRKFRIEADVAMQRQHPDEEGGRIVMDALLDVYDAVLDLPHGGHDGTPKAIVAAARRAASIVSALHVANGRNTPGTCVYVPRTPWRHAAIVRHRSDGGGAFLRKQIASTVLADDPVCVSITKADDWYHLKGAPGRHTLAGTRPDAVEALRLLASLDASIRPSEALVARKGERS